MPDRASLMFDYPAHSRAFLGRAVTALAAFDTEDRADELFRAALELRFGIEARLFEYIEAALKTLKQEPKRIKDYSATKLLARLTALNPRAEHRVVVRITSEQTGSSSAFQFTPVTRELAIIHGKLGALLHFTYFSNNSMWYLRHRLDVEGVPTLLHARDLIQQGINELSQATAGSLLASAWFTERVAAVNDESASDPSAGDGEGAA
jgi:hypothetical protein